jgi:magnesium transporter
MTALRSSLLFIPELKDLLQRKDYRGLKAALAEIPAADLADGWGEFSPLPQIVLFKLLPVSRALDVFEELQPTEQMRLLCALEFGSLGPVLEDVPAKEAARLFHRLPERVVRRLTIPLRQVQGDPAGRRLPFPDGSAGALMHTDALELHPQMTATQALDRVRAASRLHRLGDLHVFYVTDDRGRLLGSLSPRALIAAPLGMTLGEIMAPVQLIKIRADAEAAEAAKIFAKYKLVAAPVVDGENHLLGVLTVDDILHVVSQEATEDIAKMAGTTAEELESGSALRVARLRMPWLATTCLAEVVVGGIVRGFEHTLAQVVALASFMPLIAAMGGNVGTQSSTLCVRGLATGHIQPHHWRKLALREFLAGLTMGAGYGLTVGIVAFAIYHTRFGPVFPLIVGGGVFFSMTVASTLGALQPFLLHRLKMDPAVAVGPLVSTITDLLSVTAYLSLAALAHSAGWLVK